MRAFLVRYFINLSTDSRLSASTIYKYIAQYGHLSFLFHSPVSGCLSSLGVCRCRSLSLIVVCWPSSIVFLPRMAISTLAVDTIADYMLDVGWRCVDTSSINPWFRVVVSTKLDLSSLFHSMGLKYRRRLFNIVQATNPPLITWFKTLPNNISRRYWGVYMLIL